MLRRPSESVVPRFCGCGPPGASGRHAPRYRIKGSRCIIDASGARLYFGAHRFETPLPVSANALYILVEPNRNGPVVVSDGGLTLTSGLRVAIIGKARAAKGLRRGTFTLFAHIGDGKTDGRRFSGSWRCG